MCESELACSWKLSRIIIQLSMCKLMSIIVLWGLHRERTVTETIEHFHPSVWKKNIPPCLDGFLWPFTLYSYNNITESRNQSVARDVRQTNVNAATLSCSADAIKGILGILHCAVLSIMVVHCVPSFCVFCQRLSVLNFIKVCWITEGLCCQLQS